MNKTIFTIVGILFLSQAQGMVMIQFDYSLDANGFFNSQARRDVLNSAGAFFETHLGDTLDTITPGGSNTWTATFGNPATGNQATSSNLTIPADTLIVFAGGRNLGGSTLGIGGPGGFTASGSQSFLDTVGTRGETGAPGTDFGPWGGSLAFNDTTNWYFDPDTSSDEAFPVAQSDFFSVALHELGHLLGFGTAQSWDNQVAGGNFTGTASTAIFGNNVPLAGDNSHWQDGTTSTIGGMGSFETAMDPVITTGDRKRFTDLDLAALQDVGWEVTPIPLPASVLLFVTGIMVLFSVSKRNKYPLN